jgi:hypothetical protein
LVYLYSASFKTLYEIAGLIFRNFRLPGIVHYQFIPESKTVNKEMYTDIIHRLRDAIRKQHPVKWRNICLFNFHDNAPAHRSAFVKDSLTKSNDTTLENPHTLLTCLELILFVPTTVISSAMTALL